jgi:hypothetical protein
LSVIITRGERPCPFRSFRIKRLAALALRRLCTNVENKTILIDGTPQPVFLSTDGDDDLMEVPFVTEPAG